MWHNVIFWKIHAFSRGDTMQASRQGRQFTGNSQIQNTLAPLGIPWVSVNKGFVCNGKDLALLRGKIHYVRRAVGGH
jgi:hypothetical protein